MIVAGVVCGRWSVGFIIDVIIITFMERRVEESGVCVRMKEGRKEGLKGGRGKQAGIV